MTTRGMAHCRTGSPRSAMSSRCIEARNVPPCVLPRGLYGPGHSTNECQLPLGGATGLVPVPVLDVINTGTDLKQSQVRP